MPNATTSQSSHLSRLLREAADTIDTLAANRSQEVELKKIYELLEWSGFPVQADVDKATEDDFVRPVRALARSRESISHDYEALKLELAKLRETIDLASRTLTAYGFGECQRTAPSVNHLADAISSMRMAHLTTIQGQERRIAEHRNRADTNQDRARDLEKEVERMKAGLRNLITDNNK